ncbi:Hypothetical predicted protein [Podarcis lilfordi]|uniref:Uncharacterized protein n=1 Tax=Podarcis lilfordi TaxID=74358 RepID=A0AA35K0S3_9SAUR|nr:Hypothetical predicted protein [Podarcis lilfordi]
MVPVVPLVSSGLRLLVKRGSGRLSGQDQLWVHWSKLWFLPLLQREVRGRWVSLTWEDSSSRRRKKLVLNLHCPCGITKKYTLHKSGVESLRLLCFPLDYISEVEGGVLAAQDFLTHCPGLEVNLVLLM